MGHTYFNLWIHLIWGTKNREPVLTKEIRIKLHEHIVTYAKEKNIFIDSINGYRDHVHCLISINPKNSISDIANLLKGESSHWLNDNRLTPSHFSWASGFSVFSISHTHVDRVRRYVDNQEEHHRKTTYSEEIEKFLSAYNLPLEAQ